MIHLVANVTPLRLGDTLIRAAICFCMKILIMICVCCAGFKTVGAPGKDIFRGAGGLHSPNGRTKFPFSACSCLVDTEIKASSTCTL